MSDNNLRLHETVAANHDNSDPYTNGSLRRRIFAVLNSSNALIFMFITALSISSLAMIRRSPTVNAAYLNSRPSSFDSADSCSCEMRTTTPEQLQIEKCPFVNCMDDPTVIALENERIECMSGIADCSLETERLAEVESLFANADQQINGLTALLVIKQKEIVDLHNKLNSTSEQWLDVNGRMERAHAHVESLHLELIASKEYANILKSHISTLEQSLDHFVESFASVLLFEFEGNAARIPDLMVVAAESGIITEGGVQEFAGPMEAILAVIENTAKLIAENTVSDIRRKMDDAVASIRRTPPIGADCVNVDPVNKVVADESQYQIMIVGKNENLRDFALATAGSIIVSDRTSRTYFPSHLRVDSKIKNLLSSIGFSAFSSYVPTFAGSMAYDIFGIVPNVGAPTDALNHNMDIGSCWPMEGTNGAITIKLKEPVMIASISIDHIPTSHAVNIHSAPRTIEFYGLLYDGGTFSERFLLSGMYDVNRNSSSQNFPVTDKYWSQFKFRFVTLKILDNHGLPEYTCLYRVRVHGELSPK